LIESVALPVTLHSNAGDFIELIDSGIAKVVLSGSPYDYIFIDNIETSPVPLPGTLLLFGAGLAGLAETARRRRKALT
jgi:hypothetical protein